MRVNLKTGLRAGPNDSQVILEAFKSNEEPDDAYSIIGFQVSDTGTSGTTTANGAAGGYSNSPMRGRDVSAARQRARTAGAPPPRPPGW